MITCPWCGTNYLSFQSNCRSCGGPLNLPEENPVSSPFPTESVALPPAAPRPISNSYLWRLLLTDGWAITAMVFGLLGVIFGMVGAALTMGIITAFVGIPFLLFGVASLAGAIAVGFWRYGQAQNIVKVLRIGEATPGRIVDVTANYSVRVNGRHPWTIRYQFQVNGQEQEGSVTTLNPVRQDLQAGKAVYVLYLPDTPRWNSIYPHP